MVCDTCYFRINFFKHVYNLLGIFIFFQNEEIENVRVVARVRPLSVQETEKKCRSVVTAEAYTNSIYVFNPNNTQRGIPKCFNFDVVFEPDTKQVYTCPLVK